MFCHVQFEGNEAIIEDDDGGAGRLTILFFLFF